MANTIAHLAVAEKVLSARPELVTLKYNYYLGTIAPDAIESKVGAVRDDKKLVHLRLGISDKEWLRPDKMRIFDRRLEDFIQESIYEETDIHHKDFSIGYLVHLLTDKFNHSTIRLRILNELIPQGFEDGNWNFIHQVLNELEALDCYLLRSRPELSALFYTIMELPVRNCMPGYIEAEYLEKSLKWWKSIYAPQISQRKPNIVAYHEIDDFVDKCTEYILGELDRIIK
jgi:hypothetical protein